MKVATEVLDNFVDAMIACVKRVDTISFNTVIQTIISYMYCVRCENADQIKARIRTIVKELGIELTE